MGGNKKGSKIYTKITSLLFVSLLVTMDVTPLIGYSMDKIGFQEDEIETIIDESEEVEIQEDEIKESTEEVKDSSIETEEEVVEITPETPTEPEQEEVKEEPDTEVEVQEPEIKKVNETEEGISTVNSNMSRMVEVASDNQYTLATDYDFSGTTNGTFVYDGDDDYVEIPRTIKGVNITSYARMFEGTDIKGVKSTNKNVTNMSNMFRSSDSIMLDLTQFDTSGVTTMAYMFAGVDGGQNKIKEIKGIENFNTSKVQDMSGMFSTSDMERLDLRSFDTSSVNNMERMFYVSRATEILGLDGFDTSQVYYMASMFATTSAKEIDLRSFDTSKVQNMSTMFMNARATEIKGLETFDTSTVSTMTRMFESIVDTSIDVSSFDTTKVEDMNAMFRNSGVNELDVSNFNTVNVRNMSEMFNGARAQKLVLGNMDTRNVTSMAGMFSGAEALELDLTSFDTTKVMYMGDMFYNSKAKDIHIGTGFKTLNVTDMSYMFSKTQAQEIDLWTFNTAKVTTMDSMFSGSQAHTIKGLGNFNTANVTDMGNMFNGARATNLDVSSFNTTNVDKMVNMFKGTESLTIDLSSFDTTRITDMSSMFEGATATNIDVTRFSTASVYSMNRMFKDTEVSELDLSSFDMTSVNDTEYMFEGARAVTGLSKSSKDAKVLNSSKGKPITLNFTPKYEVATDEDFSGTLNGYFKYIGDENFVEIPHIIKGINVNNYTGMFEGTSVRGVVSTNTRVTDMSNMFKGNTSMDLDVRGIVTDNVTNMEGMFKGSKTKKLDLSNFNTTKVTNMASMFENTSALLYDLGAFNMVNVTKLDNIFKGSLSTKGYARTTADASKLNGSLGKSPSLVFTVWSVTTEQTPLDWTNEAVNINVSSNNDYYDIDYIELMNGEGRNLLTDSSFDKGRGELTASSSNATIKGSIYTLVPHGTNIDYTYTDIRKNLVPNETYTLSIRHKNNVPIQFRGGVNVSGYSKTLPATNEWKVSHITFTTAKTDVILRMYFATGYGMSTSKMEIDWMKLEKGNKPTPWTLAPEDEVVVNNKKEYQVSVNGSYIFRVTDTGGNEKTVSHTVSNIDTVIPTAELTKSTEGWTSQDVTIYANAKDTLSGVRSITLPDGKVVTSDKAEYKALTNGEYTFKITDNAGNTETYTEEVTNIDRSIPKISADIDNKAWTRDPINIKVTSEDSSSGLTGIEMINSPLEGRNLTLDSDVTFNETSVKGEGRELRPFSIASGGDLNNLSGKDITVSLDLAITGYTDGRIGYEPAFKHDDGSFTYVGEWYGRVNQTEYDYGTDSNFKGRLSRHVKIQDKPIVWQVQHGLYNQLEGDAKFTVGRPKFEVGKTATPWTPAPEDIELINNTKTYPVVANGLYTFEAKYNNNATSEVSVNVTNIDLVNPTLTVKDNPEDWVEDGDITLTIEAKDTLSGVSKIVLPDGREVKGTTASYKVNANGNYDFKVVDNVGNETTHTEKVEYLMIPYSFYIYDKNSKPVEGVDFELLRDGEAYKKATSDSTGLVDFGRIPPVGKYSIRQLSTEDGYEFVPEDVETPDVNEPVEFISYPRGTTLPSTGTMYGIILAGLLTVVTTALLYVKGEKRKVDKQKTRKK